jgi:hypothetical protein
VSFPPSPVPTFTPDLRVFDVDPTEVVLLAEEVPGIYLYGLSQVTLRPNSEVLILRGEEAGQDYIDETGRVLAAVAEYVTGSIEAPSPLVAILVILFKSNAGPAFLFQEKGGACREDEGRFTLQDPNLGIGDMSVVCSSTPGSLWVRVGYRNIYFDVGTIGSPEAMDRMFAVQVALEQLGKLQSFPLSSSVTLAP